MIRYALAALVLFLPTSAVAAPGYKNIADIYFTASDGTSFSAEDMTGPAQTSVYRIEGLDYVELFVKNLAVSGTADVTVNCYTGKTNTTATYHVQSEKIIAGASTHSDYVPTKSVTTSKDWSAIVPVGRARWMYCTFTCASGTVDLTIAGGNF